jgi:hypothetical protein
MWPRKQLPAAGAQGCNVLAAPLCCLVVLSRERGTTQSAAQAAGHSNDHVCNNDIPAPFTLQVPAPKTCLQHLAALTRATTVTF